MDSTFPSVWGPWEVTGRIREPLRAVEPPRGGGKTLDAVPSDQFCEQSLFLVYKLFDFVLDGIGTDIGRFGEELRSGWGVTFKTRRRR